MENFLNVGAFLADAHPGFSVESGVCKERPYIQRALSLSPCLRASVVKFRKSEFGIGPNSKPVGLDSWFS